MPYSATHLTIPIIREFNNEFAGIGLLQEYVLFGKRDGLKQSKYDAFENEISTHFTYEETEKQLSFFLKKKKQDSIIVHGDSYPCIRQAAESKTRANWICWGYVPPKGYKWIVSNISFFIRKKTYNRLNNIVCLLLGDKNELEKIYDLKNAMVLPYMGIKDTNILDPYIKANSNRKQRIVYVGNSGHNYQSYLNILPILSKYKGQIKVHVMFQYPNWPDKKELVNNLGRELFGDDFVIDETLMDIHSYRTYMSDCDIYICNDMSQTGLGAIHFCAYVGKKIYIAGKNLEWEKELGVNVFNTDDIKDMSFESFSRELTVQEKEYNKEEMKRLWDQKDNWIEFLLNKC